MRQITQKELREACNELHTIAEKTRLAQELISGSIDPLIYKNYCFQLYLIADAIERKINLDTALARRVELVKDVAECPPGSVSVCAATIEYVGYLDQMYSPSLTGWFKGHIYAHYLGWLYGGQMISKNLSLPKHHLRFDNVKGCVDLVRNEILDQLHEHDANEAKVAFSYIIKIYDELYKSP